MVKEDGKIGNGFEICRCTPVTFVALSGGLFFG